MGSKLLLTTTRDMYMCFRLVPKSMTLNDLCARFKVICSLNAAKMAKYSLVMTLTPCKLAGCIISIRPTSSCNGALTYLFTYTFGSGSTKLAISLKRLKIERKLLLTARAYIKSYTGYRFLPKCMTLNDLGARFKDNDSLNAVKITKYSLIMTPTPCRVICL